MNLWDISNTHRVNKLTQPTNSWRANLFEKRMEKLTSDIFVNMSSGSSIVDMHNLPPLKATNNILTVPDTFFLGVFNGKEINMRIFPEGGLETTNSPRIPGPFEGAVTPEQKRLFQIAESFSRFEHETINEAVVFAHGLSLLTNGKCSLANFNERMDSPTKVNIPAQLTRVGIDYSKPFTVNGTSFIIDGNNKLRYAD